MNLLSLSWWSAISGTIHLALPGSMTGRLADWLADWLAGWQTKSR